MVGCGTRPGGASERSVSFPASDGVSISGTLYVPPGNAAPPGIVLVHDVGEDAAAWAGFAKAAQHSGYLCLAYAMRGHGETAQANPATRNYREFEDDDWQALLRDLDGAVDALREAGADPNNIGVAGAGLGGSVAMAYAAKRRGVQAVAVVSPGLDFKGYDLMAMADELQRLPVMLIAAEGDSYAAMTSSALEDAMQGFCEIRMYPGSANGTDLLAVSDGAVAQLVQWFDGVIGEGHGAEP